ncbi:MAG: NAD(P)/FAD-dependent oxidoreductase [Oscillospiraceae bacterium]|nr:NAD(P)/FAD-dependent oxidoreductase [Oscillospiraceae bacterium]
MAVIISQIKTDISAAQEDIVAAALKRAGISHRDVLRAGVHKTSLDARNNNRILLVSSVWAELSDEKIEKRLCDSLSFCSEVRQGSAMPEKGSPDGKKVVIAGFGPAGMFAALTLAEYGYKPVVLERGGDVDERTSVVTKFWGGGALDTATNVQFGEGGAGTFSDGKLTTRINDPLCRYVLEKFTQFGAPEEILIKAKPHIGTDNLRTIVKAIRSEIIRLGGEVRFHAAMTDLEAAGGEIRSVTVNGNEVIPCDALILAIGHSARDTFKMLDNKKIFLEAKPFSVGARIEHKQEDVNRSLYGKYWDNPNLPKGEYQLSYRQGERAVYTFCMCPGGMVVPSSSEEKTVVTNGMSEFARDGENANSALVVSVSADDFGRDPLSGVEFAADIERKAYILAGENYTAPAATVGSFLDGGGDLKGADVSPTYAIGVTSCNFDNLFPKQITEMMRIGLSQFSRKMKCFGNRGAVLTSPETRTSSPVRITRNESMMSVSVKGLYPCGEGAGYAGGIMSAAVDGIKCALKIIEQDK